MKDNLQLIGQVLLIVLGPILAKHGISVGNDEMDKILGGLSEIAGIAWKFWHWNSTPDTPANPPASGIASKVLSLVLVTASLFWATGCRLIDGIRQFDGRGGISHVRGFLFLLVAGTMIGCAHLQPGADPLVVNVERSETVAKSTFDLVLHVDDSKRDFFRTNAPAFHNFCEWLRQPQTVEVTNTLPRASALLISLDDVKLDYKVGRASSNDVVTILATVQGAMRQASSWLTVITNR